MKIDNKEEVLAEKDAEIARLIEKYNEAKAAPHYPDGPWDIDQTPVDSVSLGMVITGFIFIAINVKRI
jgi:hypothetical protein